MATTTLVSRPVWLKGNQMKRKDSFLPKFLIKQTDHYKLFLTGKHHYLLSFFQNNLDNWKTLKPQKEKRKGVCLKASMKTDGQKKRMDFDCSGVDSWHCSLIPNHLFTFGYCSGPAAKPNTTTNAYIFKGKLSWDLDIITLNFLIFFKLTIYF